MLLEVRRINVFSSDVDDLVAALAFAEVWAGKYESLKMKAPEWLGEKITELRREIGVRSRDQLALALRQKRLQLSSLKTRDERKVELAAEIAELEKQLA